MPRVGNIHLDDRPSNAQARLWNELLGRDEEHTTCNSRQAGTSGPFREEPVQQILPPHCSRLREGLNVRISERRFPRLQARVSSRKEYRT